MSWDRIEGQWKQQRGKAVYHWGKVMNDELAAIAGKYEELVGRLQEKYGVAKEETKQQIRLYRATVEQLKKSNSKLMELQHALSKRTTVGAPKILSVKVVHLSSSGKKSDAMKTAVPEKKSRSAKVPTSGKKSRTVALVPVRKRTLSLSKG